MELLVFVLLSAGTVLFTASWSGLTVVLLTASCLTGVLDTVLLASVAVRTDDPVVVPLETVPSLLAEAEVGTLLFHLVE